jgi:hypothetical protein
VAPGLALSIKEDTDEDVLLLLHLMVLMDPRKGSGGKGYYAYLVLIDFGETSDYISQSIADELLLKADKT